MTSMRNLKRFLALVALGATATSCGDVVRNGRAPSYLVIDSLQGIRGAATTGTPASTLISDVITNVIAPAPCAQDNPCPTIFGDAGEATMHIALKDPGTATNPSTPTEVNAITITRYHVDTSAPTATIRPASTSRTASTARSPSRCQPRRRSGSSSFASRRSKNTLVQLKVSKSVITTIARVTFYGRDQAGNDVTATGSIQVDFGNYGDF